MHAFRLHVLRAKRMCSSSLLLIENLQVVFPVGQLIYIESVKLVVDDGCFPDIYVFFLKICVHASAHCSDIPGSYQKLCFIFLRYRCYDLLVEICDSLSPMHLIRQANRIAPSWPRADQLKASGSNSVKLRWLPHRRKWPVAPFLFAKRVGLITRNCRSPCCFPANWSTGQECPLHAVLL